MGAALGSAAACSDEAAPGQGPGPGFGGDGDQMGMGDGDNPWNPNNPGDGDGTDPGYVPGNTTTPWVADHSTPEHSGLDASTVKELQDAAGPCGVSLVYPYPNTVFPGGLLSPPFMWTGGGEAAYIKASYAEYDTLDYQWAGKVTNGEIVIPQEDWVEIARRTQGTSLMITLNVKKGSTVGSCKINLGVARGNMTGAVYYNTYNHPETSGAGAVLRLNLGAKASQLYLKSDLGSAPNGPCRSCHSVSADGSTIVASEHRYPLGGVGQMFRVASHKVGAVAFPPEQKELENDPTFGALTPDGSLLLSMGNPQCTNGALIFPRAPNNFMLGNGPSSAQLIDTKTGAVVAATGLNSNHFMWMAQFSPAGDKVVFNHAKLVNGVTDRRELAIMDFNQATKTFSNLRVISTKQEPAGVTYTNYAPNAPGLTGFAGGISASCSPALPGDGSNLGHIKNGTCSGPCYPAWPFFTPDGNGIIYSLISEPDFAVALPGREKASKSELWYIDLTTKERVRLDNANKALAANGLDSYYPTVLPVQVGGYYWLFFTSTRDFGTRKYPPALDIGGAIFGTANAEAIRKRVWVSAIRPRIKAGGEFQTDKLADPSLPAFYLEGQSDTGNTRTFAALNPCKAVGNDCTSGIDCCTGFCQIADDKESGVCVEEVTCSHLNERCETTADCCPPAEGQAQSECLGGSCGFLIQ